MSYITTSYTHRIQLPIGVVEETIDLGVERDSSWTKLDVGTVLPAAHGGQIPGEQRLVEVDPNLPSIAGARAGVHQALTAASWIERLVVEEPATGPTTYSWRDRGATETQTSTTPPAYITDAAEALEALYTLAPH